MNQELNKGEPAYYAESLHRKLQQYSDIKPDQAKSISIMILDEIINSHPDDWAEKVYYSLAKAHLKNR